MKLVSGLFKIVCATCPAHAVIHEFVHYQDGLLIHYECHGKTYLAVMAPYFQRVITHRDGERYQYAFDVQNPNVECLRESVEHIYVLDTELVGLSQDKATEMQLHLAEGLLEAESMTRPTHYSEDEWSQLIDDRRKTLALLTRFVG